MILYFRMKNGCALFSLLIILIVAKSIFRLYQVFLQNSNKNVRNAGLFLNCISTIDTVSAGHIYLDGKDVTEIREKEIARFRRENLGFKKFLSGRVPF